MIMVVVNENLRDLKVFPGGRFRTGLGGAKEGDVAVSGGISSNQEN